MLRSVNSPLYPLTFLDIRVDIRDIIGVNCIPVMRCGLGPESDR
jgi:hypothetical protein